MLDWKKYPDEKPTTYGIYLCRILCPSRNGNGKVDYEVEFFTNDKRWVSCDDLIVTHWAVFNRVGE